MSRARENICDVLIEGGIDHVFGIPGGGTIPIWNALYDRQDKIRAVLARHEQAASCMADLYGRVTGKPAVLMGQGAFVASSGGFGILEAYLSGSPMIVLTDTSDGETFSQYSTYQSGSGEYGSFDIRDILRGMSKYVCFATTPEETVTGVQLAIKHATTGRPGPACVVMRPGAINGEINPDRIPRIHSTKGFLPGHKSLVPAEDIEEAARLLSQAKRPVIVAGQGVHLSKSHAELTKLSEMLTAPVATSYKGKSAMAEVHPLALGMMGAFGQKVANLEISQADLLLVAGCHMSPSDTKNMSPGLIDPSRQKIIQIDIEPLNAGWTWPVDLALVGDLKDVLGQLTGALKGKASPSDERAKSLQQTKAETDFFEAPETKSDASPILPQRLVKEIEAAVDDTALITLDAGNNRLWMSRFFKSKAAGSVFCPGGVAGMGWGPPAAVAAKLLHPDRPVLSVAGDGGFTMTMNVLSTAVQYDLPLVFLVMNNSVLGMVRDGQRDKPIASEFTPTNFAQIGQAFGCNGVRVTKVEEIQPAIKEAFQSSKPTVIDVEISSGEAFFKIIDR
jgi:acetolactate synthase-1/2/3 large subunit